METFKRVLAGLVIVVSILGLILCLSGIIGIWTVNTPLTDYLVKALVKAETVLAFSQDRLDLVVMELTSAQDLLTTIKETVSEAGKNLDENSPTLTFLSNTVGTELKPKLETTTEMVTTIRGTIVSVNSTLEAANSIPFVTVPTLPMEKLATIDQQMQEIVTNVKSVGDAIRDVETGVINRTTEIIIVPVDNLALRIDQVKSPVDAFNSTLAEVETSVTHAKERIPPLIDWGSILITLILVWFTLAQASLLYGGWYYLKTETLPTV